MDLNQLKTELIQKIISCEDENVLREIEQILDENPSEVKEKGERYITQKDNLVPDSHYQKLEEDLDYYKAYKRSLEEGLNIDGNQEEELMKRYQDYLEGKGKTYSWDEVKKNIREKHGF